MACTGSCWSRARDPAVVLMTAARSSASAAVGLGVRRGLLLRSRSGRRLRRAVRPVALTTGAACGDAATQSRRSPPGDGPRRSLLLRRRHPRRLSGGRLLALEEAGCASTMPTARRAARSTSRCCCRAFARRGVRRWRALDVRRSRRCGRRAGCWRAAVSGARQSEGIRRVFPALGVDVERIRAARGHRRHVQRLRLRREGVHRRPAHRGGPRRADGRRLAADLQPGRRARRTQAASTPSGSRTRTSPRRCGAAPRSCGSCGASATTASTATAPSSSTCT